MKNIPEPPRIPPSIRKESSPYRTFGLPYSVAEKALSNNLPSMVKFSNTKNIQKTLRITVSPIVFSLEFFAMMFFPIPMMFFIGLFLALGKAFGCEVDEDWNEICFLIFSFITVPYKGTEEWIVNAKFIL